MVYGMENYIKILAVAIVLVFAGCKDWLDVTPAGQATESDLFSTGDGYRSVLNGLYKSMGKPELYGRNWSYGMLDCMAQLYNLDKIVNNGDGAALMKDPELAGRIVEAVVKALPGVPVTAKFRRGWDLGHCNCVEFAQTLEQAGGGLRQQQRYPHGRRPHPPPARKARTDAGLAGAYHDEVGSGLLFQVLKRCGSCRSAHSSAMRWPTCSSHLLRCCC